MDDLNVRAAKCLGWSYQPCKDDCYEAHHGVFYDNNNKMYAKIDLKFTTSYDWAMLGVKEIAKKSERRIHYNSLLNELWCDFYDNDDTIYPTFFSYILSLTPEQITQAWVEVLEQDKTNERKKK